MVSCVLAPYISSAILAVPFDISLQKTSIQENKNVILHMASTVKCFIMRLHEDSLESWDFVVVFVTKRGRYSVGKYSPWGASWGRRCLLIIHWGVAPGRTSLASSRTRSSSLWRYAKWMTVGALKLFSHIV